MKPYISCLYRCFLVLSVLAGSVTAQDSRSAAAEASAALQTSQFHEWWYWQEHAPELDPIVAMPGDVSNAARKARGVASEVQGCWWCERVETTQQACACRYNSMDPRPPVRPWMTETVSCSTVSCPSRDGWDNGVFSSETVPYQDGYRKRQIGSNYYVATITSGHSTGFNDWWNWALGTTGSSSSMPGPGGAYSYTIDGSTSASESVWTEEATAGNGAHYKVYHYSCGPTGSSCSTTTSVWPTQ